ncbi:MAG TPA: 3-dehydroquinate synthase [Thermodesulfobacteriaceae bacterium]|nr:3-dehydroquinate synthase [Thermodesulfobacteriaceae bacterium]
MNLQDTCQPTASDNGGFDIQHIWHTVTVALPRHPYDILIGPGLLTDLGSDLNSFGLASRYIIITDSNVEDFLALDLVELLRQSGIHADLVSFPAGEESKHMNTVVQLAKRMIALGADRQSAILALGGGVVGDVAGFLASIYMRGIPFVQIPTTLLAQVDSSVGGKTGVDLPEGKNLLGTFCQPARVYADIGVLATLPGTEIRNGLAEVIKYGMIRSPDLFQFLEERWWDVINLEPETTAHIVSSSCTIKADVVVKDEREGGLRRILNFGHTIGHAVEAAADYKIAHGEAVAIGMAVISTLAATRGLMDQSDLTRLNNLLDRFDLPRHVPAGLRTVSLIHLLQHDKKSADGKVHFVLPEGIGRVVISDQVTTEEIESAIDACRPDTT